MRLVNPFIVSKKNPHVAVILRLSRCTAWPVNSFLSGNRRLTGCWKTEELVSDSGTASQSCEPAPSPAQSAVSSSQPSNLSEQGTSLRGHLLNRCREPVMLMNKSKLNGLLNADTVIVQKKPATAVNQPVSGPAKSVSELLVSPGKDFSSPGQRRFYNVPHRRCSCLRLSSFHNILPCCHPHHGCYQCRTAVVFLYS